ncbi:MAG TPA: type III-B CRISPR module RAMP protein Cmr1, partial [Aquificales bacterium]|nr:type III-B CRISPR module RAMP protein Cmr1 [Aquificales bacterium]
MYSKLEFELEFITPAFIGGAFNQEKEYLELRPASLIGSLRYWFRNLLGTITDDVDAIYKLEEELFGSQQKAGAVKVRVKPKEVKINDNLDHLGEEEKEALSYIGFGNIIKRENKRTKEVFYSVRPYLDIGSKYKITFLVPKKYEDLFVYFLYLYNFLGSLGGRSRRGWGNFILKPVSGLKEEFRSLNWEVFDIDSIKWIYKSLKAYSGIKLVNDKVLWSFKVFEPKEDFFKG